MYTGQYQSQSSASWVPKLESRQVGRLVFVVHVVIGVEGQVMVFDFNRGVQDNAPSRGLGAFFGVL